MDPYNLSDTTICYSIPDIMIVETTMWQIQCDRCGKIHTWDSFIGWGSPQTAKDVALDSEWITIGGDEDVHSCPDCWVWDEEEEDEIFKPGIIINVNQNNKS